VALDADEPHERLDDVPTCDHLDGGIHSFFRTGAKIRASLIRHRDRSAGTVFSATSNSELTPQ
jgi:hypothetical protein